MRVGPPVGGECNVQLVYNRRRTATARWRATVVARAVGFVCAGSGGDDCNVIKDEDGCDGSDNGAAAAAALLPYTASVRPSVPVARVIPSFVPSAPLSPSSAATKVSNLGSVFPDSRSSASRTWNYFAIDPFPPCASYVRNFSSFDHFLQLHGISLISIWSCLVLRLITVRNQDVGRDGGWE